MKWLNISLLLVALSAFTAYGEVVNPLAETELLSTPKDSLRQEQLYERRLRRYTRTWNHLIPNQTKMQFAGGMGLMSFGLGWDYGRREQWETDFFVGFVPRFSNDKASITITLKQNYIPWSIPLTNKFAFEPLETGIYVNRIIAEDFWGREPSKYNGPYYRFASAIRINLFLGQRITYKLSKKHAHKSMSFFYEFSMNDLYLVSLMTNKYLSVDDALSLSLGLKFKIF